MKKKSDPRHQKRQKLVKYLFAQTFVAQPKARDKEAREIHENIAAIDDFITAAAPEWPIDKIAKIDLAILRLAVFELVVKKQQPSKVIIDEAVELAKEFGSERSPAFINGVLGTLLKKRETQ